MADARIRQIERRAALGDPDAEDELRAWKARQGECDHVFYIKGVEQVLSEGRTAVGFFANYSVVVKCDFCVFSQKAELPYNPLDEIHRLVIEWENDTLKFIIDDTVKTCFRLGFVRLGSSRVDRFAHSLVTNVKEWVHVSRVVVATAITQGQSIHAAARGAGDVRVLKNGAPIATIVFKPPSSPSKHHGYYGRPARVVLSLTQASYISGRVEAGDILDVEIRYTGESA